VGFALLSVFSNDSYKNSEHVLFLLLTFTFILSYFSSLLWIYTAEILIQINGKW
jgi:hypothetical protein